MLLQHEVGVGAEVLGGSVAAELGGVELVPLGFGGDGVGVEGLDYLGF